VSSVNDKCQVLTRFCSEVMSQSVLNCSTPLVLLLLLLGLLCLFVAALLSSVVAAGNRHAAAAVLGVIC